MDLGRMLDLLRSLRLDTSNISAISALAGRVGARGLVTMARAYLGPVAFEVEARWCRERNMTPCERVGVPDRPPEVPPRTGTEEGTGHGNEPPPGSVNPNPITNVPPETSSTLAGLDGADLAIIGMALNKLAYEAGELALHNPTVAADGRHPEFKLDAHGCPPALSLSHIVAARRYMRGPEAEVAEEATESTRTRLQRARAERYANRRGAPAALPANTSNRLR